MANLSMSTPFYFFSASGTKKISTSNKHSRQGNKSKQHSVLVKL